jgi:hypothetical protein
MRYFNPIFHGNVLNETKVSKYHRRLVHGGFIVEIAWVEFAMSDFMTMNVFQTLQQWFHYGLDIGII